MTTTHGRALKVALPLLAAAAGALPAAASAALPRFPVTSILPGQAIGGVHVGMPVAVAKRVWGGGGTCTATATGTRCLWEGVGGARATVLAGRDGKVSSVSITLGSGSAKLRALKTLHGIGLGSTRAAVRRAYPTATSAGTNRLRLSAPEIKTTWFSLGPRVIAIRIG